MISHTLTNIQSGKLHQLQSYIDNRDSDKTVGLRSIIYLFGWYNVNGKQYIATQSKRIDLEDGFCTTSMTSKRLSQMKASTCLSIK